MLDLAEELSAVFYGDDFACTFVRQRLSMPDQAVVGILGIADDDALEGRVLAAARTLRMPAASDVRAGDVLEVTAGMPSLGVPAGTRFKVLEVPQRVGDGAEVEALLGSVVP